MRLFASLLFRMHSGVRASCRSPCLRHSPELRKPSPHREDSTLLNVAGQAESGASMMDRQRQSIGEEASVFCGSVRSNLRVWKRLLQVISDSFQRRCWLCLHFLAGYAIVTLRVRNRCIRTFACVTKGWRCTGSVFGSRPQEKASRCVP